MSKKITKIVVTGGPCAGKTTAFSWIQNAFSERGYTVLFVPETATELITGGVIPSNCRSGLDFQRFLMNLQLEKEKIFDRAAENQLSDKVLVVCDRGLPDAGAFMTDEEYRTVLCELGKTEVQARDGYDAVFHLVTAAKGAVSYYTTANNTARTETPQQAAAVDDRLISSWTGHPHLRVIDNSTDFEGKMKRLIAEILVVLGEPEPLEIERKFLIEYPDIAMLENDPNCRRVEIVQTYLKSKAEEEVRIRRRGNGGSFIYYKTVKRRVSDVKRIEIEERLSQSEYELLMNEADPARRQICKTRYCLTYEGQYFEIDVFPFWNDRAIAEIELSDENDAVRFPDFLKVIKEVTDDELYKNASLAKI